MPRNNAVTKHHLLDVGEAKYNVYTAGDGPCVLLLHGFSQSAAMWSKLIDRWRSHCKIVAPDLKGIGGSSICASGYEKRTLAQEVMSVLDLLGIRRAAVVGHDLGLMVAYAFAAQYPEATERLVLMDAFLPGIASGDEIYNSPDLWHFRFHGPHAEKLVAGRERIFLDSLWTGLAKHPERLDEDFRRENTEQYAREGRMRAGFEYFKALPEDAKDNRRFSGRKLKMPVLALGGADANAGVTEAAARAVAEDVTAVSLPDCGHWLMEEAEPQTARVLDHFVLSKLGSQTATQKAG